MIDKSASRRYRLVVAVLAISSWGSLLLMGACIGERRAERPGDTAGPSQTPPSGQPSVPPAAGSGGAAGDPQTIALGQSIFQGRVAGGTCFTCHGQDAKGTQLAPNLTDGQWLNSDGSFEAIVGTVTTGVAKPKQYPAAMPPMGGAQLSPDQIRAVAAYVHSLSRGP